jgi:hypothetical protein
LKALGVEVATPAPEVIELPVSPAVRRVIAEVSSLRGQGVDYLLLPDLQLGAEIGPGDVVSPWMHDLEAALSRYLPGLPAVLRVPAELSLEVLGLAAELGQTLTRNPMTARRALEQTKNLIRPQAPKVRWAGNRLIGVVAQPQLLDDPQTWNALEGLLAQHHLSPVKPDVAPAALREEGEKLGLKLKLPTDLEAAGMHRYFSRVGRVKGLLYLHDPDCAPLPTPLRKLVGKGSKPSKLVVEGEDWSKAIEEMGSGIEGL